MVLFIEIYKSCIPTMHILLKAEKFHHGVWGQLSWVWVSHTGVTGASKHMAPVLPQGVDTSFPYLQEQTPLDAVKDAVGVIDLAYRWWGLERFRPEEMFPHHIFCSPLESFSYQHLSCV